MKKTIASTITATAMALTIALTGCGGGQQDAKSAPAQEQTQQQTTTTSTDQAASDTTAQQTTTNADAKQQTTSNAPAQQQTTSNAPAQQQTTTATAQISMDDAKAIALSDAGVAEQDTTDMSVELDNDGPVAKYEVSFNVGMTEFDYEIDPTTGAIMSSFTENDD